MGSFYHRLDAMLDLSFLRGLVRDCYASSGRPSVVDPVVFFRLQLVMFFEDIRSERRLMEVAAGRLSVRWSHPHPRALRSSGLSALLRANRGGVLRGGLGVGRGALLRLDHHKVRANADVDSLRSRSIAQNHLKELFEEIDGSEKKIEDFITPHLNPD